MIHGLVRSPLNFFDITPTAQLINKFSNDLGILDNSLCFVFLDVLEMPISTLVAFINIFQINIFFMIPGFIGIFIIVLFFVYCKRIIIETKKLDLKSKTFVFKLLG